MVGTSTFPAEWMAESQWVADRRNLARPVCEQPPYCIFVRGPERDVFPTAQRHGMGLIVSGPLNGGWFPGKYRSHDARPDEYTSALHLLMRSSYADSC